MQHCQPSWAKPSLHGPCNSTSASQLPQARPTIDAAGPSWARPTLEAASPSWARPTLGAPGPAQARPTTQGPCRLWAKPPGLGSSAQPGTGTAPQRTTSAESCVPCGRQTPSWANPALGSCTSACRSRSPRRCQDSSSTHEVNLTMGCVILAAGLDFRTSYDEIAACPERIDRVLQEPCVNPRTRAPCAICQGELPAEEVKQFCSYFRRLSPDQRSVMLSTCSNNGDDLSGRPSEDDKRRPINWSLLGHRVCIRRLLALLGMHAETFYKHRKGMPDLRAFNGRSATTSGMTVDHFFTYLWLTTSEDLPEDGAEITLNEDVERRNDAKSQVPPVIESVPEWDRENSLLQALGTLGDPANLRPKWIQHQKIMDIWWQYLAWVDVTCPLQTHACWATFWRRWESQWKHIIKIRKKSQHAECVECSKYSHYIHYSHASAADKQLAAKRWHEHLIAQYRDLLIYWNLRMWSRLAESDVLTIIIDSMDKTKCCWPQYTFRLNKALDKYVRPRICITCVIAHGYCTDFYLADDEDMFHGASTLCEILTRTLERVRSICEFRGRRMPRHLIIQSDNTIA